MKPLTFTHYIKSIEYILKYTVKSLIMNTLKITLYDMHMNNCVYMSRYDI